MSSVDDEPLVIRAVGDVMLGSAYFHSLVGPSIPDVLDDPSDQLLDDRVIEMLSEADLLFGNLECVISEDFERDSGDIPPSLMAPIGAASVLETCGFDVLNLANNHILDHGPSYVEETIGYLEELGIEHVGYPFDGLKPLTIQKNDHLIRFTGHYIRDLTDEREKERIISQLRDGEDDKTIDIVSLHWGFGGEHMDRPSPRQIEFGRRLVDSGADVVLGHHSHTLQPVEEYNDGIIAYSLGNFIFDHWRERNRLGGILTLRIDHHGHIEADMTVTEQEDYRVNLTDKKPIDDLTVSRLEAEPIEEYRKESERVRTRHKIEVIWQFLRRGHKFPVSYHLSTYKRWSKRAIREIRR